MDLSKILSISGKPGLFKLVSQTKNGALIESLIDGKRQQAFANGHALVNTLLEDGGVGDEQVIPHQLHLFAELVGQQLPAFPVVFGHAVFDGNNGVFVTPGG